VVDRIGVLFYVPRVSASSIPLESTFPEQAIGEIPTSLASRGTTEDATVLLQVSDSIGIVGIFTTSVNAS
jgi:hypothetical protein